MANKPYGRGRGRHQSRGRLVYLPFDTEAVLGTLADNGISTSALQVLAQDFEVVGVKATVTFSDVTAGDGPLEVGWSQSQLTGVQVVANRDASPTSQWDVLAAEQSRRKVRVFGTSSGAANESLNDGKPMWRRMYLRVPAGQALCDIWIINRSGAALQTGALVHSQGEVVGRWR